MTSSESKNLAQSPRTRSRGFPVVPLSEAADVVRRAGKYGHSHSLEAFAGYMGHQTTNSGAFKQRFAALRDWGLVTTEREQVVITELGRRIAHPVSPEDAALAMREAFMEADVFAELYNQSAKGMELEVEMLANRAVHQLGVSPKRVRSLGRSFAESAVAAGLAVEGAPGRIELRCESGARPPAPASEAGSPMPSHQGTDASPLGVGSTDRVIHQVWPVDGGAVAFEVRLDRALPAQAFAELAEIFQAVERLVSELRPSAGSAANQE